MFAVLEVKSLRGQVAKSEAARRQAEEVVRKEAATVSALEAKVSYGQSGRWTIVCLRYLSLTTAPNN